MNKLIHQVRQKSKKFTKNQISVKEAFRNENGAIDLASIMVGIIVIGLIGGVIAATVFAVIPWSQDNAAKHQLDSIVAAQSAYMGLASDSPPALPSGHKANSFANSDFLASANLLQKGSTYCAVTTDGGKGYQGFSQSFSGKVWNVTDKNTKPVTYIGAIPSECNFIVEGDPETETPYVDPTPRTTTLTYKCDIQTSGRMPMQGNLNGTEIWNDGTSIVHNQANNASSLGGSMNLLAGIEYKVTFEGTYTKFNSYNTSLSKCLRSVDHWGMQTGTVDATLAFFGASSLTSVPEHIPSTVTNLKQMFSGASIFNQSLSKWDVSNVTNMEAMFSDATQFDQPLENWDVSKVEDMSAMFNSAYNYNQPLNEWNVSKVKDMNWMFARANEFDQPLDKWNTEAVLNMTQMFFYSSTFNQNLSGWNVENVTAYSSFSTGSKLTSANLPLF